MIDQVVFTEQSPSETGMIVAVCGTSGIDNEEYLVCLDRDGQFAEDLFDAKTAAELITSLINDHYLEPRKDTDHELAILINAIRDAIDQPAECRDDSGLIAALWVVEGE